MAALVFPPHSAERLAERSRRRQRRVPPFAAPPSRVAARNGFPMMHRLRAAAPVLRRFDQNTVGDMLRGLRQASSNWLGKAVMAVVIVGVIVISFAIWGIGDIFRGFGRSTLAKIGHTEITIEQFRQLYNEQLQQLGRQFGRPITMEQARALGIDRQVIGQLIAETALDERAARSGSASPMPRSRGGSPPIRPSRASTASSTAALRGGDPPGRLHRAALCRRAAQADAAASDRRTPSSAASIVPKAAVEAADRYQNEQRIRSNTCCSTAPRPAKSAPPTPEELAIFFDDARSLFRAPEYRKIVVAVADPERTGRTGSRFRTPTLKTRLRGAPSRYLTPERRHIQQIVFPNADEANGRGRAHRQGRDAFRCRSPRNAASPTRTSISAR